MIKNKIILSAETKLEDLELRKWVDKMYTKIETINERTKQHTLDIRELRKKINNERTK